MGLTWGEMVVVWSKMILFIEITSFQMTYQMIISRANEYLVPFFMFCAGFQSKMSNLAIFVGVRGIQCIKH